MKTIVIATVLILCSGTFLPVNAFWINLDDSTESKGSNINAVDISNAFIPFARSSVRLSRPRFETVHMVIGIGGLQSNFSELKSLGVNVSNFNVPISIYIHIPFQNKSPSVFFLGGWDISLNENITSFKAMLQLQTSFRLMLGVGVAKSFYSYNKDNLIIDASQAYALLTLGYNLSPQRVDLLLTVPVAASLSNDFEGKNYTISPGGIQFSLLISIR